MIAVNDLKRTSSFIRFLLVGIVNTIVGLTIMFILYNLVDCTYWAATFIGNTIGAAVSFVLNRSFTFNSNVEARFGVPRFIVVILVSYLFSYSVSSAVVQAIPFTFYLSPEELSILGGTVLYTLTNYIGQKRFVFTRKCLN